VTLAPLVIIRTINAGGRMENYEAGTLAGAGCFRCTECGYAVALHELDEVPDCPHCGSSSFARGSIFGDHAMAEPSAAPHGDFPDWLVEARDALIEPGHYLAYETDLRVCVISLQEGWTRLGRSLSAHVRFDDPTVSRRHALIHCEGEAVRILDDRSLNGLFLNGERVDWHALSDGDEITIGRFSLFYIALSPQGARSARHAVPASAG
jgi:hypothetical protein